MLLLAFLLLILFPVLAIPALLVLMITAKKKPMAYAFLFSISVAILLSKIIPTPDLDLYRYYGIVDLYSSFNSFTAAIRYIWGNSDPLSYSYLYVLSIVGGKPLLPAATSIIVYCIYFYIIFDYSKIKKLDKLNRGIIIVYFLSALNVINTMTGIRYGLGLATFVLATYIGVIKKKSLASYVLYISSILLHSSMVILLLFRLLVAVFKKYNSYLFYFFIILFSSSVPLIYFISSKLANLPFLNSLSLMANFYLPSYFPSGIWYLFNIFVLSVIIIILFYNKNKKIIEPNFFKLNTITSIFAASNVFIFYLSVRMITVSKILFVLPLIDLLSNKPINARIISRPALLSLVGFTIIVLGNALYQFQTLIIKDYGTFFAKGNFIIPMGWLAQ